MARRSNHPRRLMSIALLASAVSARTISLSSFELISSIFISPACLDAYNTPLQGCELQDFLLGRECSQTCITNLRRIEATIQDACSAANPRPGTLLSRTKGGELVTALCGAPAADDDGEDDEDQQMTTITTTTQFNTDFPVRTTTVTKAITPKPAPTSTTTTIDQPPPPATTEESSTEVEEETSTIAIDLPSSSSSSSEEAAPTERSTTLQLVPGTSTTSETAGNTAPPAGDDGNDDNSDNGRFVGSGGGGLEGIGFEDSGAMSNAPKLAVLVAAAGSVMGWQLLLS
ncbi:hypothetical protein CC79DRAFT_854134 [Sarocladium strictum]